MQILEFLRSRDWTETLEVAKGLGLEKKSDVNPTLYKLKEQGHLPELRKPLFFQVGFSGTPSSVVVIWSVVVIFFFFQKCRDRA